MTFFIKSDGSLWAMGYNHLGQLGDGTAVDKASPTQILSSGVIQVKAGGNHSIVLKSDGSLWAVGWNAYGQLGDGTLVDISNLTQIVTSGVTKIATGAYHTLFVKSDGSLWGMGHNDTGKLGDGTLVNKLTPIQILSSGVSDVAAADAHSLVLKTDGSLWAMGANSVGELGDGSTTNSNIPLQMVSGNVVQISADGSLSQFVKADGSSWGTGFNGHGQLGDGTMTNKLIPTQTIASGVTKVTTGGFHSLFIKSGGSLWGTGNNPNGQLGDGTTTSTTTPIQILSSGVADVASGGHYSIVLKTDGSLWSVGQNTVGQLGDGTTTDKAVLTQIIAAAGNVILKETGFPTPSNVSTSSVNLVLMEFELDTTTNGASSPLLYELEIESYSGTPLSDFVNFQLYDETNSLVVSSMANTLNGNILFESLSLGLSGGMNTILSLRATTNSSFISDNVEFELNPSQIVLSNDFVIGSPHNSGFIPLVTGNSIFELSNTSFMPPTSMNKGDIDVIVMEFEIHSGANVEVIEEIEIEVAGNVFDITQLEIYDITNGPILVSTLDFADNDGDALDDYLDPNSGNTSINMSNGNIFLRNPPIFTSFPGSSNVYEIKISLSANAQSGNIEFGLAPESFVVQGGNVLGGTSVFSGPIDILEGGANADLVGQWLLNEGSGTIINDSSINANHGALINGPVWVGGQGGNALYFDGINDYAAIDRIAAYDNLAGFAITMWIHPDVVTGNQGLFQIWPHLEGDRSLGVYLNNNTVNVTVDPDGSGNFQQDLNFSSANFMSGNWQHLAVTWDGMDIEVYVDGAFSGNHNYTGNINNSAGNITLGARLQNYGSSDEIPYQGSMQDVRFYNSHLDSSEVINIRDEISMTSSNIFLTDLFYAIPATLQSSDNAQGMIRFLIENDESEPQVLEGITFNFPGSTPSTDFAEAKIYSFSSAGFIATGDLASGNFIGTEVVLNDIYEVIPANGNLDLKITLKALGTNGGGNFYTELSSDNIFLSGANTLAKSTISDGPTQLTPDSSSSLFLTTTTFNAPTSISYTGTNVQVLNFRIENHGGQNERLNELIIELPQGNAQGDLVHALLGVGGGGGDVLAEVTPISQNNIIFTGMNRSLPSSNLRLSVNVILASMPVSSNIEFLVSDYNIKVAGGNVVTGNSITSGTINILSSNVNNLNFISQDPFNGEVGFPASENLVITFDESIDLLSGNIEIFENGGSVEILNTASPNLIVTANSLEIDPSYVFTPGANVHVLIDPGLVAGNISGNVFGGFSSSSEWAFYIDDGSGGNNIVFSDNVSYTPPSSMMAGSVNVEFFSFHLFNPDSVSRSVNTLEMNVISGNALDFTDVRVIWYTGTDLMNGTNRTFSHLPNGNILLDFDLNPLILTSGANYSYTILATIDDPTAEANIHLTMSPDDVVTDLGDQVFGTVADYGMIYLDPNVSPILVGTAFTAPGNISASTSNVTIMEFELDTITNGASSLVNEVTFDVVSGNPMNDFISFELYDESLASSVSTMANVVAGNLVFQNLSLGLSGGSNTVLSLRGDTNSSFVSDNVEFEVSPDGILLNSGDVIGSPVNSTMIALTSGGNMSATGPILVGTLFVAPVNISESSTNVTIMEFELDTITNGASSLVNEITFDVISGTPVNDFVSFELYDESLASSVSTMANVVAGNLVFQNLSLGLSGGSNTVLSLRGDTNSSFVSDNIEFEVAPEGVILSSDNVSGAPVNSTMIALGGGNMSSTGPILVGTAFTAPGNISAGSSDVTIMEFELDTITNGASSLVNEVNFNILSGDPLNDFISVELYDESLASSVSTMANVVAGNLVFQNLSLGLSGGSNTVLSLRVDANSSFVSDNIEFEVRPEGIVLSSDNVFGSPVHSTAISLIGGGNIMNTIFVAASSHHVVFVEDGELFALGRDDFGAIGLSGDNVQNVAVQIGNKTDWTEVAAGAEHSLGIDVGGNLFGWGSHSFDQLGGLPTTVETPSLISTGAPVIGVLGSPTNSYYIDQNYDVYGVGRNHLGQVATGSNTTSESTFNLILSGVSDFSVGTEHGLAIVSGNLYAWGSNGYGQLGSNTISDYTTTPVMIDDSYTWVDVEAGAFHSFAMTDAGDVFAWGKNNRGQLCDPTINDSFINQITMVSPLSGQTVKIAAGVEHTLIKMNSGSVYVGGSNDQLQAESGSEDGLVEIVPFSGADDIFAGPYSSYVTFGSNIQVIGQNVDGSISGAPQDL